MYVLNLITDDSLGYVRVRCNLENGNFSAGLEYRKSGAGEFEESGFYLFEKLSSKPNIKRLRELFEKWHLNNLKPGCEHQIGPEWEPKNVELDSYTPNYGFERELEKILLNKIAEKFTIADMPQTKVEGGWQNWLGEVTKYPMYYYEGLVYQYNHGNRFDLIRLEKLGFEDATVLRIVNHINTMPAKLASDTFMSSLYGKKNWEHTKNVYLVRSKETRNTNFLREEEHEEGLLSKKCPVCHYRYGTRWNKIPVPDYVEAEINEIMRTLEQYDRGF